VRTHHQLFRKQPLGVLYYNATYWLPKFDELLRYVKAASQIQRVQDAAQQQQKTALSETS